MKLIIAALFISTCQNALLAATWRATDPSLTAVTAAINKAEDGDTVVVPAGTASWKSTLFVTKGITLKGAGRTDTNARTVTDATVILDNVARTSDQSALIKTALIPTQSFRLTGFTFRPGSVTTKANNGAVRLAGRCFSVRVDHCHFDRLYQVDQIHTFGWLYGVVDHCVIDCRGGTTSLKIWHDGWANDSNGNGSWIDPSYWGSDKFIFIEDNIIRNTEASTVQTNASIDSKMGGRYVARYNEFYNTVGPGSHGTEGAPQRGHRALESYHNVFNWSFPASAGQLRSGTALYHDNVYKGAPLNSGIALKAYREFTPFKRFGGAYGGNPWDLNDRNAPNGGVIPIGRSVKDPGLYATGRHAGANGSSTLVVAGLPWTKNQWRGFVVRNLDQPHKTVPYCNAYVLSNTHNTITFPENDTATFQPALEFNTGDRFEIRKVIAALDQPGRGEGEFISSGSTPRWPKQLLDPVYSWNNKYLPDNSNVDVQSPCASIIENRDFHNNTVKPFYEPYVYPHPLTLRE